MPTPLSNLRVIDMSRILAGPWAGQLLGDYGADIIKIERPGTGDDTRQWGPPWFGTGDSREAAYFLGNESQQALGDGGLVGAGGAATHSGSRQQCRCPA